MDYGYVKAIETRLEWLKWSKEFTAQRLHTPSLIWQNYSRALESGDTFFMNRQFCELVDHARATIPDDLKFDDTWMQAKQGWMWLHTPFLVPNIMGVGLQGDAIQIRISAVAWWEMPEGFHVASRGIAPKGSYYIMFYLDHGTGDGFSSWSYFTVFPGDAVLDRVHWFESTTMDHSPSANKIEDGKYALDRTTDMLHEIRWAFCAFYLMGQKLATEFQWKTERHVRRRAERNNQLAPPFLRVITLRRFQEAMDKAKEKGEKMVDWQWQWAVRGHWRNQFFPSENTHRPVFIESYIKGPTDKPFKPETHRIFIARR